MAKAIAGLGDFTSWVQHQRGRTRALVYLALGALAALGHAPLGLWPVTMVAMALIYGLYHHTSGAKQAAWLGWVTSTGYFCVALSWIVEPFLVDIARHGWLALPALLALSAGLALFWGAGFALARRLGGGALALVAAIVLAEAARGSLFTGFPWAQIGHVWVDTPMLQWASLMGSLGLTALAVAAGGALWHALAGRRALGLSGLGVLVAMYLAGPFVTTARDMPSDAPVVRLIQPNAPQHEKWDPDKIQGFFDRQIEFTRAGADQGGARPDLIVWPETAVPVMINDPGQAFQTISRAAGDVPVVVGAQRRDGLRFFNALAVLGPGGQVTAQYDKYHLVPFGEYMPYGDTLAKFGIHGLASVNGNGYSPGPGAQVLDLGDLGKALPLICYEGVFPQDVRAAPERPDFLLLITNDAWFGDISGPYQHLAQARLRTVEQGLPMIRAANTGVSAMIDTRGRITAHLPLGQAGWIDAALPPPEPPTLYARMGDWPILGIVALMLGLSLVYNRRRFSD